MRGPRGPSPFCVYKEIVELADVAFPARSDAVTMTPQMPELTKEIEPDDEPSACLVRKAPSDRPFGARYVPA